MKYLFIILVLLSSLGHSQKCEDRVEEIFNDLVEGIGNNSIYPPSLEFSDDERAVATMGDFTITVERKVINLFCGQENFDDKMAYILGHEMAHHYLSHSWMANTGLGYSDLGNYIEENSPMYSKKQRKLSESQADLYAGFYGMISGYNTLAHAKETLEAVYKAYGLPDEISGYPTFSERLEIINSKIDNASNLALLFELGNVLLLGKEYELAKYCYEFILKQFNSREIYNNLGLSYLLYGVSISEEPINKLVFPVSLDQKSRVEVKTTRSGNFTDNPKDMIEFALKQFKRAQSLDSKYQPAIQNQIVAEFLLLEDKKTRNDFIAELSDLTKEFVVDLEVVNMIINEKPIKKVRKAARSGSNLSKLNTTNPQFDVINKENILKKSGIDPFDLIMSSGKNIGDSKLNLFNVNGFQVVDYKGLYVINFNFAEFLADNLSEEDKKGLIHTNKGSYLVYKGN
jgi:tetratricopeptide (TPR) repeat protein